MQITSKGQVTIPQNIRTRLGLLPRNEVEFELARIRMAKPMRSAGILEILSPPKDLL
jgi:bifunctional DNA-binding transcriptional regulator/antitoxin component of YhaV-PrlF toxin-antitoxin module